MRRILYGIGIVILLCSCSVKSFDGDRKGFNLGMGMSAAPYISWDDHYLDRTFTSGYFGVSLFIGHNLNKRDLLTWEITAAFTTHQYGPADTTGIGFNGISWSRYFKNEAPSFFTTIGVGQLITTYYCRGTGLGYLVGLGYEPVKHLRFSVKYIGGKTTEWGYTFQSRLVMFSLTGLLY